MEPVCAPAAYTYTLARPRRRRPPLNAEHQRAVGEPTQAYRLHRLTRSKTNARIPTSYILRLPRTFLDAGPCSLSQNSPAARAADNGHGHDISRRTSDFIYNTSSSPPSLWHLHIDSPPTPTPTPPPALHRYDPPPPILGLPPISIPISILGVDAVTFPSDMTSESCGVERIPNVLHTLRSAHPALYLGDAPARPPRRGLSRMS
jgi:hypothetical protein